MGKKRTNCLFCDHNKASHTREQKEFPPKTSTACKECICRKYER